MLILSIKSIHIGKKVATSVPTQLNGEWPSGCCQILRAGRPQRASASRDGEYGPYFENIVDDVQSGVSWQPNRFMYLNQCSFFLWSWHALDAIMKFKRDANPCGISCPDHVIYSDKLSEVPPHWSGVYRISFSKVTCLRQLFPMPAIYPPSFISG